jgi:hypothetical protein
MAYCQDLVMVLPGSCHDLQFLHENVIILNTDLAIHDLTMILPRSCYDLNIIFS